MSVKIRLMRMGKRKQPTYRVVVADSRSPRNGRFIEILGQYAPRAEPSRFEIDEDRALHWLKVGARPTEQVSKLLDETGVYARFQEETGREPATKVKISTTVRKAKNEPEEAPAGEAGSETSGEGSGEGSDAGSGDEATSDE